MTERETRSDARPVHLEGAGEFEDLRAREGRLLVEFYTNGCSMCAAMEPVLGNVARATDATVALINAGHAFELSAEYGIGSVPSLLLFEDGELVGRLAEGFVGAERVVEFVERGGAGGDDEPARRRREGTPVVRGPKDEGTGRVERSETERDESGRDEERGREGSTGTQAS
jgi:thiol-disulfide isomerase/thioredoxin